MRFVVAKLSRVARSAHRYLVVAASIGVLLACTPTPANAQGTTITVPVCDTAPATIAISTPQDNSVFDQSTVTITGTLYRLTQIQVYLNNNYIATVPLDSGATTFTTDIYLYQGTNTVKLVGVDSCTPDSPEVTWTMIYAPGATPTVQPTPPGTLPKPVEQVQQAVFDSSEYLQNQVSEAAQSPPAQSLTDILYEAMVKLDMAPKNAPEEEVNRMLMRTALIVTGTVMAVSSSTLISLYHLVRYQILKWNIHALPMLVHRHATLALRVIGAILIAIPFLFIV